MTKPPFQSVRRPPADPATSRTNHRRRLLTVVLALAGIAVFLRMCVPQLWGPYLPPAVTRKITESHTACIGIDEVPIWPGDPRQAQCSSIQLALLAERNLPRGPENLPVSKVVCYRLVVENPFWETMGQTRHEILTSTRTYYKVAVLQGQTWTLFPDEDAQDRSRWLQYGCPTPSAD